MSEKQPLANRTRFIRIVNAWRAARDRRFARQQKMTAELRAAAWTVSAANKHTIDTAHRKGFAGKAQMSEVIIEEFKPIARNSLCGFARVRMPSGMIIHDVGIYAKEGTRWASPPSKPAIGRDGTVFKKDNKPVYTPIITFASKEGRNRFSNAVVAAIAASHPGAFP